MCLRFDKSFGMRLGLMNGMSFGMMILVPFAGNGFTSEHLLVLFLVKVSRPLADRTCYVRQSNRLSEEGLVSRSLWVLILFDAIQEERAGLLQRRTQCVLRQDL